jgi:CelD/BcsL family acetyltransferase involved in cellulose biosynthesis
MAPRIEVITCLKRFAEIKPNWDALWRRCKADVFCNHAWIATWLESSHGLAAPRIAVAWDGDDILAAIPLVVCRRFGFRTLEWPAQSMSDYCDALAMPEAVPHLSQLWIAVWQAGRFDLVNLAQVRPDALVRPLLDHEGIGHAIARRQDRQERCFAIDCIWPNSEAWFRSLGKKGRNNFWRGERILVGYGGDVAFRCLDPAEQSIEAELRHVMALKREWLRTSHPSSPLLGRDGATLDAMLHAITDIGLMRLFLLMCGDKVAAASVNFVCRDRLQAYMTTYDPAFERASPGMVLIMQYTRWAFDRGLRKVDFLRGDEPFKLRLANVEISLNSYLGARTGIGRAALAAHRWRARSRNRRLRGSDKGGALDLPEPGVPHVSSGNQI